MHCFETPDKISSESLLSLSKPIRGGRRKEVDAARVPAKDPLGGYCIVICNSDYGQRMLWLA